MSNEDQELRDSLKGYKEKIPAYNKSTLTLDRDLIFVARTQRGYEVEYDPKMEWGCSPTETLLTSLAGCLAIDMVSFLRKMRGEIKSFKMDITGERNPTPPQYYTAIEIVMHITGENMTPKQIDRAISLSQEKYCSVYHSLRPDIKVSVKYKLNEN